MSVVMQINPFDFFTDTSGDALDSGFIYIGEVNKDPRQYPTTAYYDQALTIPAAMPLRTSNGYVFRNGAPTFLYIDGNYSVLVQDKKHRQIYYVADFLSIGTSQALSVSTFNAFVASLASTVGSTLIGWIRSAMTSQITTVGQMLSAQNVSIWEYASLVVSKPNPADPTTWDWTPAIQSAIDTISAAGGGSLEFRASTYPITAITMKAGVVLLGPVKRLENVMALATASIFGGAALKASGTAAAAITYPSNSWAAGASGIALDCTQKSAGHGILLDDAAGVLRPGNFFRDVLVYAAPDRGIMIKSGNKEPSFERVFVRGGLDFAGAVTVVGWDNNTTDATFTGCWAGFCQSRGILDNGGASRWINPDIFGNNDVGVEVKGSSSDWDRLQVDGSGGRGLFINGADDANFVNYVSIGNCVTTPDADVVLTGDCRSIQFVAPKMRGSTGFITAAFRDEGSNTVQVLGGVIATAYPESFNDRALAYWHIDSACNPVRELRPVMVPGMEMNENPFFTTYSGAAPVGWTGRSGGTAVLRTVDLPSGGVTTGTTITSSAVGTSGIQIDLTADVAKYLGMRIRVRGLFKGDSSTLVNNQQIQIFFGAGGIATEIIPNDGTWNKRAVDAVIPLSSTFLQIRLVAANNTTAGVDLGATAVSVKIY